MRQLFLRLFVATVVFATFTPSSSAGPARELDRNIGRVLAAMHTEGKATLPDIALGRESLDTIEIEPMQVWAKDAKIVAYGAAGEETLLAPPDVKYFKGRVKGEDESAVFFSRSANGAIRGLILLGDRRWMIGTGIRQGVRPTASVRKEYEIGAEPIDGNTPLLISEIDEIDDLNDPASSWKCDVGTHAPDTAIGHSKLRAEAAGKLPVTEAGNVTGASYQLRLAIETDDELYAGFSSNAGNLTTYIGDLIAKASIVYSRDLSTTLLLGQVNLRTGGAGTDPWTKLPADGTGAALAEFGTYWHNNYSMASVPRSSVVFVSGKAFFGGVAWREVLCNDDIFCGSTGANCGSATYANSYAGGYAFNGSLGSVTTTVPDPTVTVNGVQYGLPTSSSFWILLEVLHELGHNVASPHSSCVALTAPEKVLYGVTRNFVDICLNGEGGCYSGSVSAPTEKGTIMSYCHNISSGGFRQSRYLFGKAGEASEKMFPIFNDGLEGATPNSTITTQGQPVACAAGRTASVGTCSGCTYAWQIDGGTITSSSTISSITYTPNEAEVTLTVTVLAERGCGITASKTITASCVGVLPPTNVVATATATTNVNVSWLLSAGATSYNVYRSTGGAYSLAGSTGSLAFNDAGRTANTAYLYKVRAVNGGESADSNIDLATTVIFTDDPLAAGTTPVTAAHVTQLRTAVNAVRTLASLGAGSYTDPTVTAGVTAIKAAHVNDLRTAIDAARSALALSALSYTDTITASTTVVEASHFTELRNGVK
jgi:hypothetical protein